MFSILRLNVVHIFLRRCFVQRFFLDPWTFRNPGYHLAIAKTSSVGLFGSPRCFVVLRHQFQFTGGLRAASSAMFASENLIALRWPRGRRRSLPSGTCEDLGRPRFVDDLKGGFKKELWLCEMINKVKVGL